MKKNLNVSFADFESDQLDQRAMKGIVGGGTAPDHTAGDVGNCDNDTGPEITWITDERIGGGIRDILWDDEID